MAIFGPKYHPSHFTLLHWVQRTFFWNKRVMRMNPRVYLVQSTATVILHISTEFQGDFCSIKELLERTHGSKAPSMSFYTSPLRSNDIILEMKELFKYITKFQGNLSQNKSSTEFQGHFSGNKRVLRMNPSIKLVQSTSELILYILTEFKRHCSWSKRGIRGNPRVYFDPKHRQFYTCPVSAKKILFEIKESSEWTHG